MFFNADQSVLVYRLNFQMKYILTKKGIQFSSRIVIFSFEVVGKTFPQSSEKNSGKLSEMIWNTILVNLVENFVEISAQLRRKTKSCCFPTVIKKWKENRALIRCVFKYRRLPVAFNLNGFGQFRSSWRKKIRKTQEVRLYKWNSLLSTKPIFSNKCPKNLYAKSKQIKKGIFFRKIILLFKMFFWLRGNQFWQHCREIYIRSLSETYWVFWNQTDVFNHQEF